MAPFNPNVKDTQDPNWLGWSKPISDIKVESPDTSLGQTIAGAGKILEAGVSASDQMIREDIKNKAYAEIDPQRDALTASLQNAQAVSTNPAAPMNLLPDAPTQEIPPGVKNGLERIQNISMARSQNGSNPINDTYYSGEALGTAKRLRTEYPGYREYIDDVVSKVSGLPVANAYYKNLMQDYNHQLSQSNAGRNKIEGQLMQYAGYEGGKSMLLGFHNGQVSEEKALSWLADAQKIDVDAKKRAQDRADTTGNMELDQRYATADYNSAVQNRAALMMKTMLIDTPYGQKNIGDLLEQVQTGQIKPDPTQTAALVTVVAQARNELASKLKEIGTTSPDPRTPSFATRMGGIQKLDDPINSALTNIDNFLKTASDDKHGLATYYARNATAKLDTVKYNILNSNKYGPGVAVMSTARNLLGDRWVDAAITSEIFRKNMDKDLGQIVTERYMLAAAGSPNKSGPQPAIIEAIQDGKADNVPPQTKYFDNILEIPRLLGNKETPMEAKLNIANYAFGNPKNFKLLDEFNIDYKNPVTGQWVPGKYGAFTRMLAQPIIDGLWDMKQSGDSRGVKAWEGMKQWSELSMFRIVGEDLQYLNKIPQEGPDKIVVHYNTDGPEPKIVLMDSTGKRPLPERSPDPVRQGYLNNVHSSIDRINLALGTMSHIAQKEGTNPGMYMLRSIMNAGFTPGPNTTGLPRAITNAIQATSEANKQKQQKLQKLIQKGAEEHPILGRNKVEESF